jgi:hypothetical protein
MLVGPHRIDPHTARHPNTTRYSTMLYALSWFVVVALLALWSLAAWGMQTAAVWTVSNAGSLSGAASGVDISLPDWLAPWVPGELAQALSQLIAALGPVVNSLLQAAPALAGGLTLAAWVVWAIGGVLILLLGAGLHLLISLWRRSSGGGSGPTAGPTLAAG